MGSGASTLEGVDKVKLEALQAELKKPADLSDLAEGSAKDEVKKIRELFKESGLDKVGSDDIKKEAAQTGEMLEQEKQKASQQLDAQRDAYAREVSAKKDEAERTISGKVEEAGDKVSEVSGNIETAKKEISEAGAATEVAAKDAEKKWWQFWR